MTAWEIIGLVVMTLALLTVLAFWPPTLRTFKDIFAPEGVIYDGAADAHFARQPEKPKRLPFSPKYAPARDEFAAWRDDPTTQFVFAAMRAAAMAQKVLWDENSWQGGISNPVLLMELRTRADAYESMESADYEGFCEWAGVDPEPLPEQETNAA